MWYVDINDERITVKDLDEIEEYLENNNISGWDADIWVSRDGKNFIEYCEIFSMGF
jgi:hypothetical protein